MTHRGPFQPQIFCDSVITQLLFSLATKLFVSTVTLSVFSKLVNKLKDKLACRIMVTQGTAKQM